MNFAEFILKIFGPFRIYVYNLFIYLFSGDVIVCCRFQLYVILRTYFQLGQDMLSTFQLLKSIVISDRNISKTLKLLSMFIFNSITDFVIELFRKNSFWKKSSSSFKNNHICHTSTYLCASSSFVWHNSRWETRKFQQHNHMLIFNIILPVFLCFLTVHSRLI